MITWSRPARGAWVEMAIRFSLNVLRRWSRPARGAWVEIYVQFDKLTFISSRPARGAWVEIIAMQER